MNAPPVPGLFPPPTREDAVNAVSRALLRIRSNGWTVKAIATELECSEDAISSASNGDSLLSFDSIARLGHKFPEEFGLVECLWAGGLVAPLTPKARLERMERDLGEIRKEIAR